ncbi:MAG: hypothetical protein JOZ73_12145, partial [Solirubrobacterales bacterium]|nr:hypothetical protein [Solirubrobacterales bacterium]
SIEHFGSSADIARAATEIGRVLRPGGHAVIITEYIVRRHLLNSAPVDFGVRLATLGGRRRAATLRRRAALGEAFTRRELEKHIIAPTGLGLVQPLDEALSAPTWENVVTVAGDGRMSSPSGCVYPMVLMRISHSVFTSVCLVLEKPLAGARPERPWSASSG